MEQKNNPKEIPEALEVLEEESQKTLEESQEKSLKELEEKPETDEIIICPNCNKEQLKIIIVSICEADNLKWYKCSVTKNCKLFQIKNI